jgi:hypothetical protein
MKKLRGDAKLMEQRDKANTEESMKQSQFYYNSKVIPTVVKRGRGRPPKQVLTQINKENNKNSNKKELSVSATQAPKRKRGRPKRHVQLQENATTPSGRFDNTTDTRQFNYGSNVRQNDIIGSQRLRRVPIVHVEDSGIGNKRKYEEDSKGAGELTIDSFNDPNANKRINKYQSKDGVTNTVKGAKKRKQFKPRKIVSKSLQEWSNLINNKTKEDEQTSQSNSWNEPITDDLKEEINISENQVDTEHSISMKQNELPVKRKPGRPRKTEAAKRNSKIADDDRSFRNQDRKNTLTPRFNSNIHARYNLRQKTKPAKW